MFFMAIDATRNVQRARVFMSEADHVAILVRYRKNSATAVVHDFKQNGHSSGFRSVLERFIACWCAC